MNSYSIVHLYIIHTHIARRARARTHARTHIHTRVLSWNNTIIIQHDTICSF